MYTNVEGEGLRTDDQTCSLNPACESNVNSVTAKTTDFNFWEDRIREGYESHEDEDNYTAYSPPMWSRNAVKEGPLVKFNHHSSYPSPNSRFQAIVEGKKELMEMTQNVPELSYELSLRDIVSDDQRTKIKDIVVHEEEKIVVSNQLAKPKARRKKSHKRGQISRSESLDSGVFMLKMFLPATNCCWCSNTKGLRRNVSTVPRSPSFDGFLKVVNTDWWKFKLLSENKSSSSCSSGSINSTGSRDAESEMKVKSGSCCWSFNMQMQAKPKRQSSGCLSLSLF